MLNDHAQKIIIRIPEINPTLYTEYGNDSTPAPHVIQHKLKIAVHLAVLSMS